MLKLGYPTLVQRRSTILLCAVQVRLCNKRQFVWCLSFMLKLLLGKPTITCHFLPLFLKILTKFALFNSFLNNSLDHRVGPQFFFCLVNMTFYLFSVICLFIFMSKCYTLMLGHDFESGRKPHIFPFPTFSMTTSFKHP